MGTVANFSGSTVSVQSGNGSVLAENLVVHNVTLQTNATLQNHSLQSATARYVQLRQHEDGELGTASVNCHEADVQLERIAHGNIIAQTDVGQIDISLLHCEESEQCSGAEFSGSYDLTATYGEVNVLGRVVVADPNITYDTHSQSGVVGAAATGTQYINCESTWSDVNVNFKNSRDWFDNRVLPKPAILKQSEL